MWKIIQNCFYTYFKKDWKWWLSASMQAMHLLRILATASRINCSATVHTTSSTVSLSLSMVVGFRRRTWIFILPHVKIPLPRDRPSDPPHRPSNTPPTPFHSPAPPRTWLSYLPDSSKPLPFLDAKEPRSDLSESWAPDEGQTTSHSSSFHTTFCLFGIKDTDLLISHISCSLLKGESQRRILGVGDFMTKNEWYHRLTRYEWNSKSKSTSKTVYNHLSYVLLPTSLHSQRAELCPHTR